MSHTTKASGGTVFIHNGDYSGDVTVIPVSFPERVSTPDDSIKFSVDIPFADLRELVFAYLWDRGGPAADPHRAGNTPDVLRDIARLEIGGNAPWLADELTALADRLEQEMNGVNTQKEAGG